MFTYSVVCLGCVTKVHCYMPYRHGEEKHWQQCCVEMGLSSAK